MSKPESTISAPGRVKEITSVSNPIIKDIRSLYLKKNRDRDGTFIAEGHKLIVDALEQAWTIRTLVHAKSAGEDVSALAARVVATGGDVLIVSEKVLGAISRRDNPQMVIGVFEQRFRPLEAVKPAADEAWVALDRVRDPGNLGTIIRTTDAAGASGVILIGDCTDPFSPEAVRATMGSIFSVPIAKCSQEAFISWRRSIGGFVAGTHLDGAADYREVTYAGKPVVLVMGNEQQGLTDELAQSCDVLIRIPQAGRADSLNLAVSTGVMLFEARRNFLRLDAPEREV